MKIYQYGINDKGEEVIKLKDCSPNVQSLIDEKANKSIVEDSAADKMIESYPYTQYYDEDYIKSMFNDRKLR